MSKEDELRQALNFLANNWCHIPHLREAFDAIFQKLKAGSKTDKANAEILHEYLSYPGSESANAAVMSLNASLQTQHGRKAAGLVRRGRGKKIDPDNVKMTDEVMQVTIRFLLDKAKSWEVDSAIIKLFPSTPDGATLKKFRKALELRAKNFVDLYKKMKAHSPLGIPLWEEAKNSRDSENNQ